MAAITDVSRYNTVPTYDAKKYAQYQEEQKRAETAKEYQRAQAAGLSPEEYDYLKSKGITLSIYQQYTSQGFTKQSVLFLVKKNKLGVSISKGTIGFLNQIVAGQAVEFRASTVEDNGRFTSYSYEKNLRELNLIFGNLQIGTQQIITFKAGAIAQYSEYRNLYKAAAPGSREYEISKEIATQNLAKKEGLQVSGIKNGKLEYSKEGITYEPTIVKTDYGAAAGFRETDASYASREAQTARLNQTREAAINTANEYLAKFEFDKAVSTVEKSNAFSPEELTQFKGKVSTYQQTNAELQKGNFISAENILKSSQFLAPEEKAETVRGMWSDIMQFTYIPGAEPTTQEKLSATFPVLSSILGEIRAKKAEGFQFAPTYEDMELRSQPAFNSPIMWENIAASIDYNYDVLKSQGKNVFGNTPLTNFLKAQEARANNPEAPYTPEGWRAKIQEETNAIAYGITPGGILLRGATGVSNLVSDVGLTFTKAGLGLVYMYQQSHEFGGQLGKFLKGEKADFLTPAREAGRAFADPAFFYVGARALTLAPVRYAAVGLGTGSEYLRTRDPIQALTYGFATGVSFKIGEKIGETGKAIFKEAKPGSGLMEVGRNIFIEEKFVNRAQYVEQNKGNPKALAEAEKLTSDFMNAQEVAARQEYITSLLEKGNLKMANAPETGLRRIDIMLGKGANRFPPKLAGEFGDTTYLIRTGALSPEAAFRVEFALKSERFNFARTLKGTFYYGESYISVPEAAPTAPAPTRAPEKPAIISMGGSMKAIPEKSIMRPSRSAQKAINEILTVKPKAAYIPKSLVSAKSAQKIEVMKATRQALRIGEAQKFKIGTAQKFKIGQAQKMRVEQAQKMRIAEAQALRIGEAQNFRVGVAQKIRIGQKFKIGQAQALRVGQAQRLRIAQATGQKIKPFQKPLIGGTTRAKAQIRISAPKLPKVKKGWFSDISGMFAQKGGKGLTGLSPRFKKINVRRKKWL